MIVDADKHLIDDDLRRAVYQQLTAKATAARWAGHGPPMTQNWRSLRSKKKQALKRKVAAGKASYTDAEIDALLEAKYPKPKSLDDPGARQPDQK